MGDVQADINLTIFQLEVEIAQTELAKKSAQLRIMQNEDENRRLVDAQAGYDGIIADLKEKIEGISSSN